MHWVFVFFTVLASLASPTTGVLAALVSAASYGVYCAARRRRARVTHLALILFSPPIGLLVGAGLFLHGPGF